MAGSELPRVDQVVKNWTSVGKAFDLRNRIVHGGRLAGEGFARANRDELTVAIEHLLAVAADNKIDLEKRIVRRKDRFS